MVICLFNNHTRVDMYIYWEEITTGHMQKISENESWSLYCDFDELGHECLYLKIGEDVHCVCDSDYWTDGQPNLRSYHVGDYFTEVVKTVFEIIIKEHPDYIDLVKIQDQVMEPFWREWNEKGYVEN